ncbi:hypothetical protein VK792_05185 [Mesobacterium sp. TK19101]|uniref:Uncharacterized protein n=1 Tax=Mesobacterium hydrothermale TaxID=3111907 RepID=A0ABU6HDX9_9RHOB|nr:hypothetical protein [Mesobacterium sp. TK19101]
MTLLWLSCLFGLTHFFGAAFRKPGLASVPLGAEWQHGCRSRACLR